MKYFVTRLENKLKTMKKLLVYHLKKGGIDGANDTTDGFNKLFKLKKSDNSHRLRTLYSYDIKENADYRKSQKIEKRIRRFYGMWYCLIIFIFCKISEHIS